MQAHKDIISMSGVVTPGGSSGKGPSPPSALPPSPTQSLLQQRIRIAMPSVRRLDMYFAMIIFCASLILQQGIMSFPLHVSKEQLAPAAVSAAVAAAWALGAFLLLRSIPDLGSREVYRCEMRLLQTIKAAVSVQWTSFTRAGVDWTVRSITGTPRRPRPPGTPVPTLVLVHGHSSQATTWAPYLLDTLLPAAEVHILDLPGWGIVPAPPALAQATSPDDILRLQAEAIVGWLEAKDLRDVILAGHSLGGLLATHVAAACPGRIAHLHLMDACGLFPFLSDVWMWSFIMAFLTPQSVLNALGRGVAVLIRIAYNAGTKEDIRITDFYGQLYAAAGFTGRVDSLWSRLVAFVPGTCFRQGWWKRPSLPLLLALRRSGLSMSITWAGEDELFGLPFADLLQEMLAPHVDMYILEECMHNPAHSNARGTARVLLDMVQKAAGARGGFVGRSLAQLRPLLADAVDDSVPHVSVQRAAVGPSLGLATAAEVAVLMGAGAPPSIPPLDPTPIDPTAPLPMGWCHGCNGAVVAHKGYWACACGAWSFNFGPGVSVETLPKLRQFLHTLHSDDHTFDASQGRHVELVGHHPVQPTRSPAQLQADVGDTREDSALPRTVPGSLKRTPSGFMPVDTRDPEVAACPASPSRSAVDTSLRISVGLQDFPWGKH